MLKFALFCVFMLAIASTSADDEAALDELDDETADDPLSLSKVNKAAKIPGKSDDVVGKTAKSAQKGAKIVEKATAKRASDELLDDETADDPLSASKGKTAAKTAVKSVKGVRNTPKQTGKGAKTVGKAKDRKSNDALAEDRPLRHRGRHPPPLRHGTRNSGENVNMVDIENNVNIDNN